MLEACELQSVEPSEGLSHFPGLAPILTEAEADRGAAVALVGEVGAGKTSWMKELASRVPGTRLLAIPVSMHDPAKLCRWLCAELGLEETTDPQQIAQQMVEGERIPAVLLDHGQNLYLRTIGGTEAFRALKDIIATTQHRTIWVCAISQHAWLYLRSAAGGQSAFAQVVELKGWSEERIGELIESRMERAGASYSFEDLLDNEPEGSARRRALERARDEYFRLLWHYTDGNLRLALFFWLKSLEVTPQGLRVRHFATPDAAATLDSLHDETRFALAAVILHENLDVPELATILRWPHSRCHSLLALLRGRGMLVENEGRYRVSIYWFRALIRHLRRRRLLFH